VRALARPRVLAPAIVVAVIAAAGLWFFGAQLSWSLGAGLVAGAATALWRVRPRLEEPIWPKRAPEAVPGARDDVVVLGWAVADLRGHVQPRAFERVRAVARDRLAQRGLDLDAASDAREVEALVGKRVYATLHSNVAHMPNQAALLACLDALERMKESAR
jgi:hypothetical protein